MSAPHCLFWNDGWRCRFLELGMAVYLAMAQVQDSAMQVAKLQDRIIQAQGSAQPTGKQYARFQPSQ